MRLANRTFINPSGRWMKVEMVIGETIYYNVSGAIQWACGKLQCSRHKFRKMILEGNYTPKTRNGNNTH